MNRTAFCRIAARLLRQPAAPGFERAVREEVQQICAEHGLECRRDPFGNVLVRLRTRSGLRPLALAAHLDHPGFEMMRPLSGKRWLARFCGGVPDNYFVRGTALRLMPGAVPARLGRRRGKRDRVFEIESSGKASEAQFAVWELTDFVLRQQRIYGRACDDLIGAAAVLATLIELKTTAASVHVIGVFSRAEEIGFQGALALAAAGGLDRDALVISLETSRELLAARMGRGVILRVGDKASIFDTKASRFLAEVAADMTQAKPGFRFQRALMSGGTCEATAYQEYGYQSAALCVALGNYHNCGAGNQIKPEYVSVADSLGMVALLTAAAKRMPDYDRLVQRLPTRLTKLLRTARKALPISA